MEGEVFRLVPGLGILKHHTVGIERIAGDHSQTVVAVHTDQLPVLRSGLLYGDPAFAGDSLHLSGAGTETLRVYRSGEIKG